MQGPTNEASVPTETVSIAPNLNRTFTGRRKAAKRSEPWYLVPPPPQDEGLPVAKKPRLQARSSISTSADRVVHAHTAERVTTDSHDDKPTYSVTPAASLPSAAASRRSWKAVEDAKLTEAVKKHGNHCVEVAAQVPGRTNVQCREHWVKTVDPTNGKNPGQPRRGWKPEEDSKLTEAVNKHGKDCWVSVAAMVSGRTNRQCRDRWVLTLDPANGKNPGQPRRGWKPEEDAKLTEAVNKYGKDCWVSVAAMVPGRTNRHCRKRWVDTLDHANGNKGIWKPEEDAKLTEAVKKHGNHWVSVAAMVPGRTDIQCRPRWIHNLDSANGNKGTWTPEEDATLTEAVKKYGKNWVAIAAMVPGRTDIQCRPRWIHTLDPTNRKNAGKWTPEEDAKLTEAVKKHGKDCWVAVAAMVPGRTNQQCRGRWVKTVDPAIIGTRVNGNQKKTQS
jgi:hypothetical protein